MRKLNLLLIMYEWDEKCFVLMRGEKVDDEEKAHKTEFQLDYLWTLWNTLKLEGLSWFENNNGVRNEPKSLSSKMLIKSAINNDCDQILGFSLINLISLFICFEDFKPNKWLCWNLILGQKTYPNEEGWTNSSNEWNNDKTRSRAISLICICASTENFIKNALFINDEMMINW